MVSKFELALEMFPRPVSVKYICNASGLIIFNSKTLYYDVTPFLYYVMVSVLFFLTALYLKPLLLG